MCKKPFSRAGDVVQHHTGSRFLKVLFAVIFGCTACCLPAQTFRLMRYDENYAYLKDSFRSFPNSIKYIPLSTNKQVYASFGGEARLEYVDFHHEDWGRLGIGHNRFLLQRYDVHADLHAGSRFRLFAQLRSAWEGGRKNGPRPIDEDHLNMQNLFADIVPWKTPTQSLTLRFGRQETDYGSGRLLSVREGPNLRLYFDGAKLMYVSKTLFIDVFAFKADTIFTGAFDNRPSGQINLWGSYAKLIIPHAGNLDGYYLGIRRNASLFEEGSAKEIRHTIGSRLWKYGGGFIYNLEAAYQFGSFGSGNISAWTASADLGYSFEKWTGKPTLNLRHDYISGDRNREDGRLQTFNPLYPKGGYFGFSPQVGPVNLIDIHPYSTYTLRSNMVLQADAVFNWRYSLQDGVYRPGGGFNLPGAASGKRYIGTAWLASAVCGINRFLSLNAGIQYFKNGAFIQSIIPAAKDGLFINVRTTFKF